MSKYPFTERLEEQLKRFKRMGWTFIGLAALFSCGAYFIPVGESVSWFSSINKQGVYVLSALFVFFGFYCWGATWRKRHFM